jgi:hypothetical protein
VSLNPPFNCTRSDALDFQFPPPRYDPTLSTGSTNSEWRRSWRELQFWSEEDSAVQFTKYWISVPRQDKLSFIGHRTIFHDRISNCTNLPPASVEAAIRLHFDIGISCAHHAIISRDAGQSMPLDCILQFNNTRTDFSESLATSSKTSGFAFLRREDNGILHLSRMFANNSILAPYGYMMPERLVHGMSFIISHMLYWFTQLTETTPMMVETAIAGGISTLNSYQTRQLTNADFGVPYQSRYPSQGVGGWGVRDLMLDSNIHRINIIWTVSRKGSTWISSHGWWKTTWEDKCGMVIPTGPTACGSEVLDAYMDGSANRDKEG